MVKNNTLEIQSKHKDWVSIAEQLIGVPYKWGGRDSIGIDCSALLQICISMANIRLPRDTKDQLKFKSDEINTLQNIRRGHLIFWPGHVAIVQNSENLLHANAHYMKVNTEKIEQAIARIEKQYGKFIKIKDIK